MLERANIRILPDGRLSRRDAGAFLGYAPKTLAEWKGQGKGPMPRRVAGRIFYYLWDLEAFRDTGCREGTPPATIDDLIPPAKQ